MNLNSPAFEAIGVVLAFFGPFWLAVTTISLAVIVSRHRQRVHARELATELVQAMLQRAMSAEEIERVLVAWSQDRRLAEQILGGSPLAKPLPDPKKPHAA